MNANPFPPLSAAALCMTVALAAGPVAAQDSNGCYAAPGCLEGSTWTGSGGEMHIQVQNLCSGRIYAQICIDQTDGRRDCGAVGVPAGGTNSWYGYNPTGTYEIVFVGSLDPGNDFLCAGGW